jgi:curli production assembly/transport component CsgF
MQSAKRRSRISMFPMFHLPLALLAFTSGIGSASEIVYVPINPSFGGSPLNGSVLLNSAQATKKHKDPDARVSDVFREKTPLEQFNEMLERSILNQLAGATASRISGNNGQLIPGTVDTGNFTINIMDLGGGLLQITTTDKATGVGTSFQVGQ